MVLGRCSRIAGSQMPRLAKSPDIGAVSRRLLDRTLITRSQRHDRDAAPAFRPNPTIGVVRSPPPGRNSQIRPSRGASEAHWRACCRRGPIFQPCSNGRRKPQASTNAVRSRCLRPGIVQTSTVEFDDLERAHREPTGTVIGAHWRTRQISLPSGSPPET